MIDNGNDVVLRQDLGDLAFQDSNNTAVNNLSANKIVVPSLTYTTSVGTNATVTNLVATNGTVTTINGTTGTYTNFTTTSLVTNSLVATSATLKATSGAEGGELILEKATGDATVNGNLTIDIISNGVIRLFESTGTNKGYKFPPLSTATAGVGSTILLNDITQTVTNKTFSTGSIWNGGIVPVAYGGTGSNTSAGALDNLLPAGEVAGYVLKTSGVGSYYWGEAIGGGGTVGSTINIARASRTATASQTLFTGLPTYVVGSNQLKVYINGVRQHTDAYAETSTTSVTFTEGLTTGMAVMFEVDAATTAAIVASAVNTSAFGSGAYGASNVQTVLEGLHNNKLNANATAVAATSATTSATCTGNAATATYSKQVPVSYTTGTLLAGDSGKCVAMTGNLSIPPMNAGDTFSIFNNTSTEKILTPVSGVTNIHIAGTFTSSGVRTVQGYSLVTLWYVSSTYVIISGSGLS